MKNLVLVSSLLSALTASAALVPHDFECTFPTKSHGTFTGTFSTESYKFVGTLEKLSLKLDLQCEDHVLDEHVVCNSEETRVVLTPKTVNSKGRTLDAYEAEVDVLFGAGGWHRIATTWCGPVSQQ